MAGLKEKFLEAEGFLGQNKITMSESVKLRLYGLTKQIKEGDCKMPQPPSSNTILRAKWEAWTSFSAMPIEKAMSEFVTTVDLLRQGTTVDSSGKVAEIPPGGIRKAGTLYKQRDVFKGWRPRHFVLQDCFLHYYLDAEDPVPRNTMDLSGCSVTTIKSTVVEGVEYFPFVITHPKSTKTYNLSSTTKLDTDIWVAKIIEAASAPVSAPVAHGQVDRLLERRTPDTRASDEDSGVHEDATNNSNLVNSVLTLANMPKKFASRIEMAMQAMLDAVAPDAAGWEPLFEKNGIVAQKRSGDVICVRGDSVLQYNIADVFEVIMNVGRQLEIDPQQRLHEVIKKFSNHTWAEYISFKGVWPTSPRDFTNLIHWRLMTDNTIIIAGFSEKFEDLRPVENGNIRGELILGGYILRPHPQGTQVHFVVQTDLKGTLPSAVVNLVSSSQPMIVYNVRRLLNEDKKTGGASRKVNAPFNYQELLAISIKGNGAGKAEDIVEIFGDPSNKAASNVKTQPVASSIDRSKVPAPAAASSRPKSVSGPKKKDPSQSKLNAVSLLVLFLPSLLYYVVDRRFRALAFIGGMFFAYKYLVRLHLGEPLRRSAYSSDVTTLPTGRMNFRFPVDLGKLLRYLDMKRDESELEITLTHVALKATAMVLAEVSAVKGHVIFGKFYPVRHPAVDLSVSYEVSEKETAVLKIDDADAKPLELITDEINTRGLALRKSGKTKDPAHVLRHRIVNLLPSSLSAQFEDFLLFLGSEFGLSIPALGVTRFPLGVCTVLTSPNQEGEADMDIMVVPNSAECATPVTVTIGGIRLLPSMDSDRKLAGSPVLNFTVSIDSKAGSLADGRKFAAKLQHFLNDPELIDKADQQSHRQREDASKRKSMFG